MNVLARCLNASPVTRVLAKALICSITLIATSCGIPPLRHPVPAPDLPDGYSQANTTLSKAWESTTENSALVGIEEFYNDPMLTGLINQAVVGNRELKILEEEVQIARNEILARQGAYLPFLTAGAGASLDRPSRFTRAGAVDSQLDIVPGQSFPSPLGDMALNIGLSWQIDVWRQLRNARDAAAQRYFAAAERRNYFVTRLIAECAENYYTLMALDQRLITLDKTIQLQEASYKVAVDKRDNGKGTELAVQRFLAEVRKNQSEKLIISQEIVKTENRINFLVNRFPQPVERASTAFFDLTLHKLSIGVPSQLLQNRPDIRQAERELAAAGLDILVARARFFPTVMITGNVGYEAFNPRYLFNPEAIAANIAGSLVAPLINKKAIQADYMTANAKQLEAIYHYQRTVLNAFTEVVNRVSKVENYSSSLEIKKQQLKSLEKSIEAASQLYQNARVEYVDVLLAQRDYMDARMILIETKKEQLSAIVNAYQALGGGGAGLVANLDPPLAAHRMNVLRRLWHYWDHEQN